MMAEQPAAIRILRPRFEQFTYEDRAIQAGGTHLPDSCGCLACADARAAIGHVPLESEWAQRAHLARARLALLAAEDEPDGAPLPTFLAFAAVALLAFGFWAGALYLIARWVR
jgi:hypothetical protein